MSRSIIITGATGVLGKVFVNYFLNKGDEVIAVSRSIKKLEKLKVDVISNQNKLKIIELDLMSNDFENSFIKKLSEMNLSPCCLVNNARSVSNLKIDNNLGLVSEDKMINEFKLNVVVPYKLTTALINTKNLSLRKVVNIGSIYGKVAPNLKLYKVPERESPIHYGIAKAALIQLTKELAVRSAKNNVNVNCIAYGGVEGRVDEEFIKSYSQLCPSRRMLNKNDLSVPLDLLLSNGSEGINGHVLMVDGGWTIW
tara:strand:- start:22893 stop:23654 length:762 start_codon:yes stop_codon:yes gene_type:complete